MYAICGTRPGPERLLALPAHERPGVPVTAPERDGSGRVDPAHHDRVCASAHARMSANASSLVAKKFGTRPVLTR